MSTDTDTIDEVTVIRSGHIGEEAFIRSCGPVAARNGAMSA
jgi:hypothetical protein